MPTRPLAKHDKVAYWACVAGSVLVIVVGWAFSIRSTISNAIVGAKEQFTTVAQTAKTLKQAGSPPPEMMAQLKEVGGTLIAPVQEAAETRQDLVDVLAEKIKTEVEAEASAEPAL